MENKKNIKVCGAWFIVLTWGVMWGIFETTVGYLLHLMPFQIGWIVWYPIGCFFMLNVYRKTHSAYSVFLSGLLSSCIKLLNLFLPVRIDRVLNPAISIVFEALSMAVVIFVVNYFFSKKERSLLFKCGAVLSINTLWRIFYALYLLFLVPDWMQSISVISTQKALFEFFFVHNLFTSLILLSYIITVKYILKPIVFFENKLSVFFSSFSKQTEKAIKISLVAFLFCSNIIIELLI